MKKQWKTQYARVQAAEGARRKRRQNLQNFFRRPAGPRYQRAAPSELKYLDVARGDSPADTTGAVTLMNGVAPGSSAITREGRQCYWKSVEVTGLLKYAAGATQADQRCDIFLIYDHQPGAAVPAMTDFFVESVAGSPHNLNFRERFKTLFHKSYVLGRSATTATQAVAGSPSVHLVSIYKKFYLRTTYKSDNAYIGDISTGAIYLVTLGTEATGGAGAIFTISTRMRFSEQ